MEATRKTKPNTINLVLDKVINKDETGTVDYAAVLEILRTKIIKSRKSRKPFG